MANKRVVKKDPMKTKTDKTRLGPLSVKQLQALLKKSTVNKQKDRINRRLLALQKRGISIAIPELEVVA